MATPHRVLNLERIAKIVGNFKKRELVLKKDSYLDFFGEFESEIWTVRDGGVFTELFIAPAVFDAGDSLHLRFGEVCVTLISILKQLGKMYELLEVPTV